VNPGHIPKDLNDGQLDPRHLTLLVYELVHANPIAVLQPFLELR
jgi:hypothetical protein